MKQETKALECESLYYLTLQEVTYSLKVPLETILKILDEGVIELSSQPSEEPRFDSHAFCRIHTIVRLKRDLGVNTAGAALAIQLLDEIADLKDKLNLKE